MAPSNLQGLNIVHPAQDVSDSQDLLLGQAYPDLAAQLDLWTNLSFESEEPLVHRNDERKNSSKLQAEEEEEEVQSPPSGEKAVRDGHVNVVTPTNVAVATNRRNDNPTAAAAGATSAPAFDLQTLLATFGLDAFAAHPQLQQQGQHLSPAIAPSLAQLLALHPNQNAAFAPMGLPHFNPPPTPAQSLTRNASPGGEESYVPAKRARTRKASITNSEADYQEEASTSATTTPLSASEDKRRRNTAASARFRLKKKEREAALEGKAKDLETKVLELERECEGLRRENGWLKGLVVGVTGAAQGPTGGQSLNVATPPSAIPSGSKRRREDIESA